MTVDQAFDINVESLSGILVVRLAGRIDASTGDEFAAAYATAAARATDALALDFTDVNYLNSSGIALIIEVIARARNTNRRLVAFGLPEHYRHIFEITRMSDFISIVPRQDDVILRLRGES
jgi:anti-sigma B factor antagonist